MIYSSIKTTDTADTVIIGAGAAGLFAALQLAHQGKTHARVIVLTPGTLAGDCASCWAQGGIAAAVAPEDKTENHARDTLKAGAGTTNHQVADLLTRVAPDYVRLLEEYGVEFDREEDGTYRLSREACHSHRRVLKAKTGDGFGKELMRALTQAVRNTPTIKVYEEVIAERLIRQKPDAGALQGVLGRCQKTGKPLVFGASAVLLATGGIGGLFEATTNPLGAVGRGLAMAARAGAVLSDLEFVQFHPTALDIGLDPAPLATEALRGEGAILVNSRGKHFMIDLHEMAELAPRDIVSRGIYAEQQKGQKVYLDCRKIDTDHFSALTEACAKAGLDPKHDLVPVAPAVHYHMGGISTDLKGRTSIDGLWAAGEVAATGLHGANRLASNSLMEAIIMAGHAAEDIEAYITKTVPPVKIPRRLVPKLPQSNKGTAAVHILRSIMTARVGVTRNETDLLTALHSLSEIEHMADTQNPALADMALVARMITVEALQRQESRGGHCRTDFPEETPAWKHRSYCTLANVDRLTAGYLRQNQTVIRKVTA